jgi:GNAT superfamily N-acetyltransferase
MLSFYNTQMTSFRERQIGKSGSEIVLKGPNEESLGSVIITEKGNTAYVGYISVKRNYQGMGYGSRLMDEAENWAAGRGLKEIGGQIIPVPGSEAGLINLLNRKGYEIDKNGRAKKVIFDNE